MRSKLLLIYLPSGLYPVISPSFSRYVHNKIKGIIEKLCKDEVSGNLVFVPYKVGSMFSTKYKIPSFLKSMVVYKFVCGRCSACYVGENAHHFYLPG